MPSSNVPHTHRVPEAAALLTRLSASARRRRRQRRAWTAGALAAGLAAFLVTWEAVAGPTGWDRALGYGAGALIALGAGAAWVGRLWSPGVVGAADRVERLFPQARGAVRDALEPAGAGLGAARAEAGRVWLARRGIGTLDRALAEEDRVAIASWRRRAMAAVVLAAAVALAEPGAARRAAAALGGSWSTAGSWDVAPGDAVVEYGGAVQGRVRYAGPAGDEPLAIEWRAPGGPWRGVPLGTGRSGTWRWEDLRASREYRPRYGNVVGPVHRLEVAPPFLVRSLEVRGPDGAWEPLVGRSFPAGERLELRGAANAAVAWAEIRPEAGRALRLSVDGERFEGVIRPTPGTLRVVVANREGRMAIGRPFRIVPPGGTFVDILRPVGEPEPLAAAGLALTVRAGAGPGLAALEWETTDGRRGELARVAGSRDTTLVAVAPVGAGRAPGDTVAYRVVARARGGGRAVTPWRRALLLTAGALRGAVAEERASAGRALDRALAEIRANAETGEVGGEAGRDRGLEMERRVQAAADSLAQALDRTLSEPELDPFLAERLEGVRRMLEGAARADLAPRAGLPPAPDLEAAARAVTLEAIRERVREIEALLERRAAADTLSRLAAEERALAAETRAAAPEDLSGRIAPRQAELEAEAREAGGRLGEVASSELGAVLEAARQALESSRPDDAATAQEAAANRMESAAAEAREAVRQDAEAEERQRRAMDRAGGEALFLAERQRELAREATAASTRADRAERQAVVTRGLERTLDTMVEAIGGRPAAMELAAALARAVAVTRYADRAVLEGAAPGSTAEGIALSDAADALAELSRALLLPAGGASGVSGAGSAGRSGALARELESLAEAQRALADAAGGAEESRGGDPDAPVQERRIADALGALRQRLTEAGVDPAVAEALARSAAESAERLERGLPGARSESELRSLARRIEDLARALEDAREERRRSEPARPFVPVNPPDLPPRVTTSRLDAAATLAPWEGVLPRAADAVARRYLERLADEGVRAPEAGP